MPDKWFHVYVSSDSINVCWIRSQTDNSMNYSKTFALTDSEIKKLTEWLVVTTGFPKAKILLEIEAPFNNQKGLIDILKGYEMNIVFK